MRTRVCALFPLIAALMIFLAACAPATPTPMPTAAPMAAPTVAPTATALPKPTASPTLPPATATPVPPTQTPKPAATATRQTFNMRAVDWAKVVSTDPNLDHPFVPDIPGFNFGPFVQAKTAKPEVSYYGHAQVEPGAILYLDLSGDGQEEAVISLFSGGTAGNTGLLIYGVSNGVPALITGRGGYKLGAVADSGQLLLREPIYAGWEANCCPSGLSETRYRLQGNQLVVISRLESGIPEMRAMTVEWFYQLLNEKRYQEAFAFLSPAFQAANPYDRWSAGYQNTISIAAKTSELPDGAVGVDLTAYDRTATGGQVVTRYTGKWTLVWDSKVGQWRLDKAQIAKSP